MTIERIGVHVRDSDYDTVKLNDNCELRIGSGADSNDPAAYDIRVRWDGTDLDVLQSTANSAINLGIDGAGIDFKLFGDTASAYCLWDQSADQLILSGAASLSIGGTALAATTTELNRAADVSTRLIAAGATLAVTEAAHDGKIICLDTATGSTCTLPAATGSGAVFRFVVSVVATSNAHVVKVTGNDTMFGQASVLDADSDAVIAYAAASTDDTLTLPGTTAGGSIGDWFEAIDLVADKWAVCGVLTCAAGSNKADVFSATVT